MNEPLRLRKYPRTPHLRGSRRLPGDDGLEDVPFAAVAGRHLVVEEKLDGANAGISFTPDGSLLLQSRGHFLTGGPRERHFDLLKQWAATHAAALHRALGDRFVLYGEWLYAKHTIFYDRLPHYFLVFDLLDTADDEFLSTPRRHDHLAGLPVASVPVLASGLFWMPEQLTALISRSAFISDDHGERLRAVCHERGLDPARALAETDPTPTMEGLYVKVEADGVVQARYKYVRASFPHNVLASESHWLDRPIVPNQLLADVDLFAAGPHAP